MCVCMCLHYLCIYICTHTHTHTHNILSCIYAVYIACVCIICGWQARLSQLCDANDYGGQRFVHELAHELLVGLQVLAAAPANPVTLACCANSGDIERARARERESLADKERGRSEIAREKREREV